MGFAASECVFLIVVGLSDRAVWLCVEFHPGTDPTFPVGMVSPRQGLRIVSPSPQVRAACLPSPLWLLTLAG